jgi:NarL family two-component system response regulator LiaR
MQDSKPIRVVLADDHIQIHTLVTLLLKEAPDILLVGQAANGQEALELCRQLQPDIVLMDVVMPVMGGIEATRLLHEQFPGVKTLVLSSFQDYGSVVTMLGNGAAGYISKSSLSKDLVETIRTTFQGKMVFSTDVVAKLIAPPEGPDSSDYHLTEREMEVLGLMAEGKTMPEIGDRLCISQSTVKFHITNICSKLGVSTRAEALIIAAKNRLV